MRFGYPQEFDFLPEERLVLRCVQAHISAEATGQIHALLQETIDWAYVLKIVRDHNVLPLVYQSLKAVQSEAVPTAILAELRRQFQLHAGSSCFLAGKLLGLLGLFGQNDISVIPFKGPSLAVSAYGSLTLRPFGDLDIFVRKRDVPWAKALLEQQGFKVVYPAEQEQELEWLDSNYHYTLLKTSKDGGELVVEIHWSIAPKFFSFVMDESWWEQTQKVMLFNQPVPCLSPEDQLLLLSVHGGKHLWERLGWICDIAKLVCSQQEIDWPGLVARARRFGSERMLLLGLALAQQLLGAPLPDNLARRIQANHNIKVLVLAVGNKLFSSAEAQPTMTVPEFYWRLQARPLDIGFYHK